MLKTYYHQWKRRINYDKRDNEKVVARSKKRTSNGENAVHFVYPNNKGFYVHICRILTDNIEWYINTKVLRKFHGKFYVETYELYQKETWELIVQAIDFCENKIK